ncbi:hypothetical protein [Terriglobus aquaticus]|uniref:Uncharacterized protein n=1 Tax=Terriglobus aquaticus TaxID=940139 RepID=A0ABW9KJH7_9BACT|nr:hypothetical protein [Terriglobus aquaticus]
MALAALGALSASAQQGRFDLLGPKIDVHVTRGDRSLPIASVPNLQPGDKLQVHADLPPSQSVHLLLVVAFLRGTTNPPPDKWFTRIETWNKKTRAEGATVTVPPEAEQALMFIAPETGGDFSTLRNAVQGRPGTFVRASQDLNEASFEQSRIERYVQALQRVRPNSPADLLDHSRKLAATLNLKPNDECFKRPADEQLSCLRQSGTSLLLDDGHGQTLAQMITNGDTSNLIGAVQGTPMVANTGAAAYSAYVGTVLDLVRLMTGLHTAHFQYIPAIAFPNEDALNLRLNAAPSFHDPKSVIVIALPAIQKAVPPPLQPQDPGHVSCLLQTRMVLPLNGAPLVFATGFAHDLVLHLDQPGPDGRTDLPLIPDAFEGGLVVAGADERKPLATAAPPARDAQGASPATSSVPASRPALEHQGGPASTPGLGAMHAAAHSGSADDPITINGTIRGYWGFDPFVGLTVPLQQRVGTDWTAAPRTELFAGRTNTLVLRSTGTGCTEQVLVQNDGGTRRLDWHAERDGTPNALDVVLPLEHAAPGGITLQIKQYGNAPMQRVQVTAYSDVTRLRELRLHAGDTFGTLTGTGLQEVQGGTMEGNALQPAEPNGDGTSLRLNLQPDTQDPKSKPKRNFKAGDHGPATLTLRDGRVLTTGYVVDAARPSVTVLNRTATELPGDTGLPLALNDVDALPLHSKVTVALRAGSPSKFSRSEKVEVGTVDGTLHTELTLADGSVVLQDSRTALAFLNPEKAFGASAFGPLQFRVVTAETASDWQPLGTLVRTPTVQQVTCPAHPAHGASAAPATTAASQSQEGSTFAPETPCVLTGANLFLIASISSDASFSKAIEVPEGFAADTLRVPRPADGHTLYLRLRDDPEHAASVTLETATRSTAIGQSIPTSEKRRP